MATARAKLVKWGNSQAIRIPKSILLETQITDGEEVEIKSSNGQIVIGSAQPKLTLESLVKQITPENRHGETDWGPPVGNEVW